MVNRAKQQERLCLLVRSKGIIKKAKAPSGMGTLGKTM